MLDSYEKGSEEKFLNNALATISVLEGDILELIGTLNKKIQNDPQSNRYDELAKQLACSCSRDLQLLNERCLEISEALVKGTNLGLSSEIDS